MVQAMQEHIRKVHAGETEAVRLRGMRGLVHTGEPETEILLGRMQKKGSGEGPGGERKEKAGGKAEEAGAEKDPDGVVDHIHEG